MLKLLGRYGGRHSFWQLLRLWISTTYLVVDLIDRDMQQEFRSARPDVRDHALCVLALVTPLIAGWFR